MNALLLLLLLSLTNKSQTSPGAAPSTLPLGTRATVKPKNSPPIPVTLEMLNRSGKNVVAWVVLELGSSNSATVRTQLKNDIGKTFRVDAASKQLAARWDGNVFVPV